jgi:putative phage-type endonuclease
MNPNFIDCEQGSKAWFDARLGCVTSSRIADVVAKRKRGEGELQCKIDMRWELVCEFLTQKPTEHYVSRWMKEGKEKEPLARAEYEVRNEVFVEQVGFAYHASIKYAGASPDGIIGDVGLIEIKCPRIETHLQYIIDDKVPDEYLPQMIWQLGCCGDDFRWNDFVSYHPDLPELYQLFQKRLERTSEVDALIRGYNLEVECFNEQVQGVLGDLTEKIAKVAVA